MTRAFNFMSIAALAMLAVSAERDAIGAEPATGAAQVQRGRYLVQITGCNDCHTAGSAQSGGKLPEKDWLTGDSIGWNGPWGTTYAINLRLFIKDMTAAQWLAVARTTTGRPPMPSPALQAMTDADLLSIYHFIRTLGPAGQPAPDYVPPGGQPVTPVVRFPN